MKKIFTLLFFCITAISAYAQPGSLDLTFTPGSGANASVYSISSASNGKFIIGGNYSLYGGNTVARIARINSNGTFDNTFVTGTGADGIVQATYIQSDGKIIISGSFNNYDGHASRGLARLDTNGTYDATFNVGTGMNGGAYGSTGIAVQPNGKVIIGGLFGSYMGKARKNIVRVNPTGSLDTTFLPGTGANQQVYSVMLQANGRIVIGGSFITYNGTSKNSIARIDSVAKIDTTFRTGTGFDGTVYAIASLPNGQIMVGGGFTYYNGVPAPGIVRLNANGTIDNTFNPGAGAGSGLPRVHALCIQPDGKILVGGEFTIWDNQAIPKLVRLNPNGSVDNTFIMGTGPSQFVSSMVLQPDGKIVLGGAFTNYNGTARNYICRVNGNLNPITQFSTSATTVCGTGSITVTDASANFPTSWLWKVSPATGASITTNTAQSTAISFTSTGTYSVQLVATNVSGSDSITKIINVVTPPTATATPQGLTSFCQGGNVKINSNAASSYSWSNGATTQSITASQTGNYFVTITDANGCTAKSNTIAVTENIIVNPGICMVTVDSISHHNIIYWSKTGNMPSDTFLVFRDTANNNFVLIGRTPYAALSVFNDTLRSLYHANGDPNVSSWRYKLAVKDSCGTISAMSPFHQTLFIQNSGGNFSWNHYQIEGQSMPVPQLNNYLFKRDDNSTGVWNTIQSLSASSTAYTDPNYASYMTTGEWRIETQWNIACDPALKLSPNAQVNKSKSNVKNNFTITSLNAITNNPTIIIAPHPVKSELIITFSNAQKIKTEFEVTDLLGKFILKAEVSEGTQTIIPLNDITSGVYILKVKQGEQQTVKKFVKE